jgi:hypothetical protein
MGCFLFSLSFPGYSKDECYWRKYRYLSPAIWNPNYCNWTRTDSGQWQAVLLSWIWKTWRCRCKPNIHHSLLFPITVICYQSQSSVTNQSLLPITVFYYQSQSSVTKHRLLLPITVVLPIACYQSCSITDHSLLLPITVVYCQSQSSVANCCAPLLITVFSYQLQSSITNLSLLLSITVLHYQSQCSVTNRVIFHQ